MAHSIDATRLMLGNEAVARGAWEAGARVVASYPGTPSTEITEAAAAYPELQAQWSVNEKTAMEIAAGVSVGGARVLTCMKHVGMNVAADPLFTLAYTGVRGGLVAVVADDPGIHSSQNEQDSRYYAKSAHLPMLVPSDAQECLDFTKLAFDLSEAYDTPVLVGTCTRIAHARSPVKPGAREEKPLPGWTREPAKYVMLPGPARARHAALEAREKRLAQDASHNDVLARVEPPLDPSGKPGEGLSVVCAGTCYQYVKEALPGAAVLKLGLVHPLPEALIRDFAASAGRLAVVEELEPFLEDAIRAMGIPCEGKALTGRQGELSVNAVRRAFGIPVPENPAIPDTSGIPARPPALCPGCPHRAVFYTLARKKLTVAGDIGCYTLGMLPPLGAMDTCLCMGASVGMAFGLEKARGREFAGSTVAVIGDSTFLHSGMTGLLDAVYNGGNTTLLILDNRITGMTGHQQNPASGKDIRGNPAPMVDLAAICAALGAASVRTLDPFDMDALDKALDEETARDGVSVILCRRACALLEKTHPPAYAVDAAACKACGACVRVGCPALIRQPDKTMRIDAAMCFGCGVCAQVCRFGAIAQGVQDDQEKTEGGGA